MKVCAVLGNKYARILMFLVFGLAFLFWPKQANAFLWFGTDPSYGKFTSPTTIELTNPNTTPDTHNNYVWDNESKPPIFIGQNESELETGCKATLAIINIGKDGDNYKGDLTIYKNPNNCKLPDNDTLFLGIKISANGQNPEADGSPLEDVTEYVGGNTCEGGGIVKNLITGGAGKVLYQNVVCPFIINVYQTITNVVGASLKPLLVVEPLRTGTELHRVWNSVKDLANVLLVLAILVVILANVFSINMDAYTMKKMLPRIVIVAVLIQFSFLISALIVDIGNVTGDGIKAVVFSLGSGQDPSATSGAILGGTAAAGLLVGLAVVGWAVILILALILVLAWLVMFLALGVRYLLITMLVVAAPLALLAWVLPNTEQYFRKWLSFFFRLVLMYPLIMLILALAGQLAKLLPTPEGANALAAGSAAIMKVVAFVAAFGMIPWTFKWAGGAMAVAGGAIMNFGKKTARGARQSQTAKDWRQRQKEKALQQASSGTGFGKGIGKLRAGGVAGVLGTSGAKRRLAADTNKMMKDRGDEYEAQFTAQNLQGDDLRDIALGHKDDAARARAIQTMVNRGDWEQLREVKAKMGQPGNEHSAWQFGTQSVKGDMIQKAPDLVKGDAGFEKITAEKLAKMDPTTVRRAMRHINSISDPVKKVQQQEMMASAIHGVITSAPLSRSIQVESLGHILAEKGALGSVQITPGLAQSASSFIDSKIQQGAEFTYDYNGAKTTGHLGRIV